MRFALLGPLTATGPAGEQLAVPGPRASGCCWPCCCCMPTGRSRPIRWPSWSGTAGRPPGTRSRYAATSGGCGARWGRAAAQLRTREPGYLIQLAGADLDVLQFEQLCRQARAAAAARRLVGGGGRRGRRGTWPVARPAPAGRRAVPVLGCATCRNCRGSNSCGSRPSRSTSTPRCIWSRSPASRPRGCRSSSCALSAARAPARPARARTRPRPGLAAPRPSRPTRTPDGSSSTSSASNPGPELHNLQKRILKKRSRGPKTGRHTRHRPSEAAPEKRRGRGLAAPRQLPATVRHFAGRTAGAQGALQPAVPGGRGRKRDGPWSRGDRRDRRGRQDRAGGALGAPAAGRFPDGQLYVDLRGFDPPAAGRRGRGRARIPATPWECPARASRPDLDAQAALYRSLLAGRRMLVVLDNARDAEQVRPLLPGAPAAWSLVTSRNQLASLRRRGRRAGDPGPAADAEARRLLRSAWARTGSPRSRTRSASSCRACARLPLALSVAAARAALRPSSPLAAPRRRARASRGRAGRLDAGERGRTCGPRSPGPTAAQARRRPDVPAAGLHPGPDIAARAAASLAAARPRTGGPRSANWPRPPAGRARPGRYAFHDLLRGYAAELSGPTRTPGRARAALHRCWTTTCTPPTRPPC